MYDYFLGKIASKSLTSSLGVVIDCNNIGYFINVNSRNMSKLPNAGETVKIFVSLIHKEDSMSLCGFIHKEDRDIFNILRSVSGVGMKMALTLLDEFSGCDLISAVIKEDSKLISSAKGVGPKLAQKIIIELKDKLVNWQKNTPINIKLNSQNDVDPVCLSETQNILLSLGYSIDEAKNAILFASKNSSKQNSSEDLIKISLEYLAKNS